MKQNDLIDAWLAGENFYYILEDPTPRFRYSGDIHPVTVDKVLRIDRPGLIEARREIAEVYGINHPSLCPSNWSDLRGTV